MEYIIAGIWIIPVVFSFGVFYAKTKDMPDLKKKVNKHETQIAVMNVKIDFLVEGMETLTKRRFVDNGNSNS